MGDWLKINWSHGHWTARRRLLQTNSGTFPCKSRLQKWPDGTCELCKRTRNRELGFAFFWRKTLPRHHRTSPEHCVSTPTLRVQTPAARGAHNTCIQQVQKDMHKARSTSKEWKFVSRGVSRGTERHEDISGDNSCWNTSPRCYETLTCWCMRP
jgi:hypothetical protein